MKEEHNWEDEVEVTDLYLASYYVLKGCTVAKVSCIPTGKGYRCSIMIKGPWDVVSEVQAEYFQGRAMVNLLAFRDAYNQVNGFIRQAKKSYVRDDTQREARGGAV
jgi:hypothetical protein